MPPTVDPPLTEQMQYVERLLRATKPERVTYLVLTGVSVAVLITSACVLIIQSHAQMSILVGLFGSSGVVTYSTGQILRIWSDAVRLVLPK